MREQALTAAEWADPMGGNLDFEGEGEQRATSGCCSCDLGSRRGLAARCMDGQEWGFTWEDVRRHRAQAAMMRESVERWGDLAGGIAGATAIEESAALSAWHDSVADRLEALLRPEVVAAPHDELTAGSVEDLSGLHRKTPMAPMGPKPRPALRAYDACEEDGPQTEAGPWTSKRYWRASIASRRSRRSRRTASRRCAQASRRRPA